MVEDSQQWSGEFRLNATSFHSSSLSLQLCNNTLNTSTHGSLLVIHCNAWTLLKEKIKRAFLREMPGCRLLFFSLNNERVAAVQKSIIIRCGQAGAQSGEANQEVIPLNTGHPAVMQLERLLWLLVMDKRLFQSSSNQYYIQKQQVMYSKWKITHTR